MSKRFVIWLTLFIIIICSSVCVSAEDNIAAAFSSTGYDGDEVQIFSPPENEKLSVFDFNSDMWYFYGLSTSTGMGMKNGIPYVYAVLGKEVTSTDDPNEIVLEPEQKTELMLDLSHNGYDMTDYASMYFGISIVGENDIKYSVSVSFYSGTESVHSETLVGVGWNLYAMDVRKAMGSASHMKVTVSYDSEIPSSIRITPPYISKNLNSGFTMVDNYLTNYLNAIEGACAQKSGRIKPENSRAVIEGDLMLTDDLLDDIDGGHAFFEIGISGVHSGNFTIGLRSESGEEIAQSKKISLNDDITSLVIPISIKEDPYSYSLVFDNIDCDVYFMLEYVKIRRFSSSPVPAEDGIGQLTKIKQTSTGLVFTGEMSRSAVTEYSHGDGAIRFYALPPEHMDDLSYAIELGQIKLTTVFEYTANVGEYGGMMYFAGVTDQSGQLHPLSRPRFADADNITYLSESGYGTVMGLFDPASVGAFESNISTVMTEIDLDYIMNLTTHAKTVSFTYKDNNGDTQTAQLDRDKLTEIDSDISFYATAGVRIFVKLKTSSSETGFISSAIRFLTERYPSILGYAVGNAVDDPSTMAAFAGEREDYSVEEYAADLALFCRSIYSSASAVSPKIVLLPLSCDEDSLDSAVLTTLLSYRLAEIGRIPLVLMPETTLSGEKTTADAAVNLIKELECGEIDGIAYFVRPTYSEMKSEYEKYQTENGDALSFTEYSAELFVSCTSALSGSHTRAVFFSLDNTNLKNSHDFYAALKSSDEATAHVYDSEAILSDSSKESGNEYILFDFSEKYYADGWIAGGGVESCLTLSSTVSSTADRVLAVSFKYSDYPLENSGSSGITLCNFPLSVNMTDLDSIDFTISLTSENGTSGSSTVVFVCGNDETRAEFYALDIGHGTEYTLSCPLDGYDSRSDTDYIGIMVYSSENVRLEISKVSLFSKSLDTDGIASLFDTESKSSTHTDMLTIALFSFMVAAMSIMAFVFLSKLEREDNEDENKSRYNSDGGKNEQKYRRQQ